MSLSIDLNSRELHGAIFFPRWVAEHPVAFRLLTEQLAGVETVTRVDVSERPTLALFEVERPGGGPLLVVWDDRNPFDSESDPPLSFDWPWLAPEATVFDALGQRTQQAAVRDGRLRLSVSGTPLFIMAKP